MGLTAKQLETKVWLKRRGIELKSLEEIHQEVEREMAERKKKLLEKVAKIPWEKKQKFLDAMHSGRTLGESAKLIGVDSDIAGEILNENIKSASWFGRIAV